MRRRRFFTLSLLPVLSVIGLWLLALAPPTWAAEEEECAAVSTDIPLELALGTETTVSGLADWITVFYRFAVPAIAIIAAVMIVRGGVDWLTAAGNPSRIQDARARIIAALSGLVIALLSFVLLQTVNPVLVRLANPCIEKLELEEYQASDFCANTRAANTCAGYTTSEDACNSDSCGLNIANGCVWVEANERYPETDSGTLYTTAQCVTKDGSDTSCTADGNCTSALPYCMEALIGKGTCVAGTAGSACDPDTDATRDCDATLTCNSDGQCAARVTAGGECDENLDCDNLAGLQCGDGTCVEGVNGDSCDQNSDCNGADGLTCLGGACTAFATSGSDCEENDDCADPLTCIDDACAALATTGALCDEDDTADCASGLNCLDCAWTTNEYCGTTTADCP